MTDHS
jgi:uncharacterized protein GlcG (DUF336 family)